MGSGGNSRETCTALSTTPGPSSPAHRMPDTEGTVSQRTGWLLHGTYYKVSTKQFTCELPNPQARP